MVAGCGLDRKFRVVIPVTRSCVRLRSTSVPSPGYTLIKDVAPVVVVHAGLLLQRAITWYVASTSGESLRIDCAEKS